MVIYINNILVYSNSMEEHVEHLRKVFQRLIENKLYVKFKKCKFGVIEVEKMFDFNKEFEIHSNASDYAIERILMQDGRPVAFES